MVVTTDGTNLYWGNDGDLGSGVQPAVMTMPIGSGSASVQFNGLTAVRGITFDDTNLYLTRAVFNVVEFGAKSGHNVQNLTTTQENGAWGMTRDATSAYWTNRGTGLVRTADARRPEQRDDARVGSIVADRHRRRRQLRVLDE